MEEEYWREGRLSRKRAGFGVETGRLGCVSWIEETEG